MNAKMIRTAAALTLSLAAGGAFAQSFGAPDYIEPAHSNVSREQVRAETMAAKAKGIKFWSAGYIEPLATTRSRDQVRAETARQLHDGVIAEINAAVPTHALPLSQPIAASTRMAALR